MSPCLRQGQSFEFVLELTLLIFQLKVVYFFRLFIIFKMSNLFFSFTRERTMVLNCVFVVVLIKLSLMFSWARYTRTSETKPGNSRFRCSSAILLPMESVGRLKRWYVRSIFFSMTIFSGNICPRKKKRLATGVV